MEYRRLGRTELQVSLLGVGGGYISLLEIEEGTRIYQRAFDLGLNYFDGRYGSSSTMLRPVIKQDRARCVVATKTQDATRDGALRRIDEDLAELDTDYLDIFYLRTYNHDMRKAHFKPGGSIEGLLQAREEGKIHFLGLAGHSDLTALAQGVETGLIDVVIFPLNIVRREALQQLVPVCQRHDVGMVVMKPVDAGLAPAEVALPWLANQPIHTMAPGISTMEHLEINYRALNRDSWTLTPQEEAEVEHWRQRLEHRSCRICDRLCQSVCESKIAIDHLLYHDVFYNELKTLGLARLLEFPLAGWVKGRMERAFSRRLELLRSCTHCGKCEQACPYGLPIMQLMDNMVDEHLALLEAVRERGWTQRYADAPSPY
ncbi:MAG: aldo/keto reductase [Chloroflexi bacterium]|nr:aldo/keto reductase [Chloroflexota bacterium]